MSLKSFTFLLDATIFITGKTKVSEHQQKLRPHMFFLSICMFTMLHTNIVFGISPNSFRSFSLVKELSSNMTSSMLDTLHWSVSWLLLSATSFQLCLCTALLQSQLVLWLWAPRERWYITAELKRTIRPYQQIRVLAVGAQLAIAPVICGLAGTSPQPAAAPWPLQTLKSHWGHRRASGAGALIHTLSIWNGKKIKGACERQKRVKGEVGGKELSL